MNNPLARILKNYRLTGPNYVDWFRNLRIVLNYEKISYVLDTPNLNEIPEGASEADRVTYQKWQDDDLSAKSYILASMSNELQRQHENMPDASSMILHLQELYGEQSRTVRYEISKKLFRMRMTEGSVNEHVLKMIDYIEQLEALNFSMDGELAIDLILQSLPDSFSQFIMNKMECSLAKLLKMLNTAETCIKKPKDVMAIEGPSTKKGKKKKFQPKAKGGIKKGKANKPNDKGKCFHCGKDGHWKRNCKDYLNSLKVKPKENPSEGMLIIETNISIIHSTSWILDSAATTHIYMSMQDLKRSRRLKQGEVSLRVGNGAMVAASAIGTFFLKMTSGHVISLNDCLFVPSAVRNIVSISCLCKDNYLFQK